MAGGTPINITEDSEKAIVTYAEKSHMLLLNQFSLRTNMEMIDRYYMREGDWTEDHFRARIANKLGDKKKIQDVTVPIVMPQVESALGYLTNVFATGYPIFGVGADPQFADAALQMETIIAENANTAGWTRELVMFFRDGLKYNLHALECDWRQRTVPTIETDINKPNSAGTKNVLWKGNVLKRMDLYNTFFDPRVPPTKIHSDGEYAGYIELYSRINLKRLINNMFGQVPKNTVRRAFESSPRTQGSVASGTPFAYYIPKINPWPLMATWDTQTFDWMVWAQAAKSKNLEGIRYQNVYEVMTIYARILPSDFGLKVPEENTPQVWKFIIVNDEVVLWAERMSNAHGYIPIFFGQPLEDGLNFQTKSFAANVMDMQDISSAMWNGFLASKRRLVSDRVLYDPMRVREKDINSTNPAAKIPVRPTAYGKPLNEAVYQFPYRDDNANSLLQGAELVVKFANMINNQNPAQQGQFVKGNKTLHEYQDVMGHGNSNNQVMGLMCEAQVFTPLKEVIKLNILQFQEEDVLFNPEKGSQVKIQPENLRKAAIHFKVSDGMLPKDKELGTEEFGMALQVLGSSPNLAASYELGPLVSYLFKMRGADLRPFEKSKLQVAYERQLGQWQQVAMEAIKAGQQPPPQPQMPQELIDEMQGKQSQPKTNAEGKALESTQGA